VTREYLMFLMKVPTGYTGVSRLELTREAVTLVERKPGGRTLQLTLDLSLGAGGTADGR